MRASSTVQMTDSTSVIGQGYGLGAQIDWGDLYCTGRELLWQSTIWRQRILLGSTWRRVVCQQTTSKIRCLRLVADRLGYQVYRTPLGFEFGVHTDCLSKKGQTCLGTDHCTGPLINAYLQSAHCTLRKLLWSRRFFCWNRENTLPPHRNQVVFVGNSQRNLISLFYRREKHKSPQKLSPAVFWEAALHKREGGV